MPHGSTGHTDLETARIARGDDRDLSFLADTVLSLPGKLLLILKGPAQFHGLHEPLSLVVPLFTGFLPTKSLRSTHSVLHSGVEQGPCAQKGLVRGQGLEVITTHCSESLVKGAQYRAMATRPCKGPMELIHQNCPPSPSNLPLAAETGAMPPNKSHLLPG